MTDDLKLSKYKIILHEFLQFFVHGWNMDSLYAHVSPDVLPEFLGGRLSEEDAWDTSLEERIFKNDENFRNVNSNFITGGSLWCMGWK